MTTITNSPASWISVTSNQKPTLNLWQKWLAIADGQAPQKTQWFIIALIVMGVLFLPLPAVLIYSFNAPITVLVISMILFFANFIAGMGGSGIRVTFSFFIASIVIYIAMAAFYIL